MQSRGAQVVIDIEFVVLDPGRTGA